MILILWNEQPFWCDIIVCFQDESEGEDFEPADGEEDDVDELDDDDDDEEDGTTASEY